MVDTLLYPFFLLWPVFSAAVAFWFAAFPPKGRWLRSIYVPVVEMISVRIPITPRIARSLLLVFGIGMLCITAVRDYSWVVPNRFMVDVFFDEHGIRKTLEQFDADEIRDLNLDENWISKRGEYFQKLNEDLMKEGWSFQFTLDQASLHGTGIGTIAFRKIRGFQNYKITEAKGDLTFFLSMRQEDRKTFYSHYDLEDSDLNFIDATFYDLYIKNGILVKLRFNQIVRLNPTKILAHHVLLGVTKLKLLPYDLGRTLYLSNPDGSPVPIGYAIYTPL